MISIEGRHYIGGVAIRERLGVRIRRSRTPTRRDVNVIGGQVPSAYKGEFMGVVHRREYSVLTVFMLTLLRMRHSIPKPEEAVRGVVQAFKIEILPSRMLQGT